MTERSKKMKKLFGFIPRSGSGLIGFVAVVVAAFFLGLILPGGENRDSEMQSVAHEHANNSEEPTTWTCSMHPQIQLPKPGKCPICFMDLIPLENSGGEELGSRQLRLSETAKMIARIETTPVRRAFAEAEIGMVGKLDYDETRVAYIAAWVPGRIDQLFIDFTGIKVKKGDQMALLYSPELIAAQEELIQAAKVAGTISAESDILRSSAMTTLEAAREKLRLYGLSETQIDEIESSGETSKHLTILAPSGGVVVDKHVNEGMYVNTGMRLYTIADLNRLWANFSAYESDLPWLRVGQKVAFTSPSFPGEVFTARVEFIDPIINAKTRTAKVRASVVNKDGRLKPDMFISGTVKSSPDINTDIAGTSTTEEKAPLLIPVTAPLITGKRAVVYVDKSDDEGPLFEGREITLGPRAGDHYIVKSGLHEGELVVTNGAFKIDAELQIQARPSMMMPEGGGSVGHNHGNVQAATVDHDKHESNSRISDISREARRALTPVYDAYFAVQMALAADDLQAAKSSYSELADKIGRVSMDLFDGSAHDKWMEISGKLSENSKEGSKAGDIESARQSFYNLSQAAIQLHDTFGHAQDMNYYLTFCPMAMDNKGAYWLQTVDTVYNSFYGASMLRCGEIKQTLFSETGIKE